MGNVIALIVTLVLALGAIVYIVRAKKRGVKCIGCPDGCSTKNDRCEAGSCACCCGCQDQTEK